MKADRVYLRHVLDAIEKIDSYASVGRDVFMSTSHWQDAIIRQLEIIGEATKRLSKGLRSRHQERTNPNLNSLIELSIIYQSFLS